MTMTLEELGARLAHRLAKAGVGPDQTVIQTTGNPWETALLIHAGLECGFTLFPLDPAWPAAHRERLLAGLEQTVPWTSERTGDLENDPLPPPRPDPPEGDRLLIASSGTSGQPKRVHLTRANLEAAVDGALERFGLMKGDAWLACLPLFHIGGAILPYRCRAAGADLILEERFDPARIVDRNPTHISLTPPLLARLLDRPPPANLRIALVGGGPLSPALGERAVDAGWPVWSAYGLTEAAGTVAAGAFDGAAVGFPLPGLSVGVGDGGEIRIKGPQVAAAGWHMTGDLGRWDLLKGLSVLGRKDAVIVTGGVSLHPQAVEAAISNSPGVAEAVVMGLPDPDYGQRVALAYRGDAAMEAVEVWSRENLPASWRPRKLLKLDEMPRTSLGKPDRLAIYALFN